MDQQLYNAYVDILKEELVPAMGCTEPIAIAFAAAVARKVLGCLPEKVEVCVSGNIIKNVKSVIVPHTGSLRGIEAAAAAGIIAGKAEAKRKWAVEQMKLTAKAAANLNVVDTGFDRSVECGQEIVSFDAGSETGLESVTERAIHKFDLLHLFNSL